MSAGETFHELNVRIEELTAELEDGPTPERRNKIRGNLREIGAALISGATRSSPPQSRPKLTLIRGGKAGRR